MLSQVVLSFSVCSLTMLSQFLFQLAFDRALTGCIRVSFVTLLFDYTVMYIIIHVLWFDSKGHALTSIYN